MSDVRECYVSRGWRLSYLFFGVLWFVITLLDVNSLRNRPDFVRIALDLTLVIFSFAQAFWSTHHPLVRILDDRLEIRTMPWIRPKVVLFAQVREYVLRDYWWDRVLVESEGRLRKVRIPLKALSDNDQQMLRQRLEAVVLQNKRTHQTV
jgi:hypothetical protein